MRGAESRAACSKLSRSHRSSHAAEFGPRTQGRGGRDQDCPWAGGRMPDTSQERPRAESRFCCGLNVFAPNHSRKQSAMLGDGAVERSLGRAALGTSTDGCLNEINEEKMKKIK